LIAFMGLLVLAAAVLFSLRKPLHSGLYALTGEEDLFQGVKGVGALLLLRLTQPPPETAPETPVPYVDVNPFGVNTFLQLEADPANVERQLALLHDAGFGWIRQEFPWEDIEIHGKGDFEDRRTQPYKSAWEKYDRIVALAEAYDIQILARLDNPPAWSRAQGDAIGTLAPPDDFNDFGDFAAAVAGRYCGRVRFYQVWNEPNIYPEWGEQDVNPEAYTELLRIAYTRIKAACPSAVVVSAALAQTTERGGRNLNDLAFLERMYRAGAGDFFDVLGAQAFGLWTGPTDRRTSPDRTNFSRVLLTREIMVRHGDADKPIWITEMGWAAVPPELPTRFGRVTQEQQARYLVDAYRRAAREWPFVGPLFVWFLRRPDWSERDQDWFYFGLIDPDWNVTPAFRALAQLASQPPVLGSGFHSETHPALRYAGDWKVVEAPAASLGVYRRGTPGAELRLTFDGSDLWLIAASEGDGGRLQITVDDGAAQETPLASGTRVAIARGLRPGPHRVKIAVLEGELSLDGFLVRRTYAPLARKALVSAFALSAFVILAAMLRRRNRQSPISNL